MAKQRLSKNMRNRSGMEMQLGKSVHTYTPSSHENLMRNFSRVMTQQDDFNKLRQQNDRLKTELELARKQVRRKQERIDSLESQLREARADFSYLHKENHSAAGIDLNDLEKEGNLSDDFRNSQETLSQHFSEVIRRHDNVLAQKNERIRELQEALDRCRNQTCIRHWQADEEVIWSHDFHTHSSIEDERLRRTEAAIKVFNKDLNLVKTQLQSSPLSEERYTPSRSRDKVVVQELQRRNFFGTIVEIEKMGQKFMEKLELEEKLDKLHWEIETKRYEVYNERNGLKGKPNCSFNEEFELLEIARHNLLKAVNTLRTNAKEDMAIKRVEQHVHFKDDFSLNTVQTLYHPSTVLANSSLQSLPSNYSEWPDK